MTPTSPTAVAAPDSGTADPALFRAGLIVAALAFAAEMAGAFGPPGVLWGAHAWAFLPRAAFVAAAVVTGALAILLCVRPPRWLAGVRAPAPVAALVCAVLAGVLFWSARCAHLLLGDGLPLVSQVTAGGGFHPLEPLAGLLQRFTADRVAGWFDAPGREPYEAVWDALALGSVIAGSACVLLLAALARELGRGVPGAGVGLVAIGLAQGAVQLFFGYVENYAWAALASIAFLLAGVRWLSGRLPGWVVALVFLAGVLCHYSLLSLAPALVLLPFLREGGPRWPRPGTLVVAAAAIAGIAVWALARPGTDPVASVGYLARALAADAMSDGARALFTAPHLRDVVNGQLLVGPVGGALGVVVLVRALARRLPTTAAERFLLAAAAGAAVVAWIASPSNLGYARNWDLLAPSALVMTVAALAVVGRAVPGPRGATLAGVLLLVSLFHTAPWIAVNASEPRALARFETLPLGGGRVESTLGYWHVLRGREAEGEQWLRRAVEAAPWNVRAHLHLARLHTQQGRHAEAAADYAAARALRPDDRDIAAREIEALARAAAADSAAPGVPQR